ncbi:MAG TPA: TadE/TadG family type IV pilus assembly protein [Burkholderiaceae bacterium]
MKNRLQLGAQAVEFALVLPFFLALLLLIVDFGFLVYDKALITNASREAARAGTVLGTTWSTGAVSAVACSYLTNHNTTQLLITTGSGTHTATCTGTGDPVISVSNPNGHVPPNFGDPVTVTVSYQYQGLLKTLIAPVQAGSGSAQNVESVWSLTAASTMIHE